MAEITFSLEESIRILISNAVLPMQILRPRAEGGKIHFIIRTGSFILPFIPASLTYVGFADNKAEFELAVVNRHVTKTVRWLKQFLELKMPACVTLDYPKIYVDVDKLLKEKGIRGIRVEDISFESGAFTIVTRSA